MRGWLSATRDTVRSQLWPLPVLAVVLAVLGGIYLPKLDAHVDSDLPGWVDSLLFGGDPGAARTVLDAVSQSLITVTSLTFSLTVVTLQLASSQFSPRLLRTFTSDVFVQATLGLFLATFAYSLTVLRTVRSSDGAVTSFVPRVSVTAAFLLSVLSVLGLVVFLAHLARQIRVETMLRDVHQDADATVAALLDRREDDGPSDPGGLPQVPARTMTLLAPHSGFLVRIEPGELTRTACELDAVIVIDRVPGTSLVHGTPIGAAWARAGRLDHDAIARIRDCVEGAVHTGYERTAAGDVRYGLRQLTDVANKALSPGINDPTTAAHALGHISALLCTLSGHALGPRTIRDDEGRMRVVLDGPTFATLVNDSITQPRRYGASDPNVMARMFQLLEELAWYARSDQCEVVALQLERLRVTVAEQDFDEHERQSLEDAGRRVDRLLAAGGRTGHDTTGMDA